MIYYDKNKYDVIVVGSGAAAYSAAERLYLNDIKNIAIVTDGINKGTSRNAGSDKQTYYKLSVSGPGSDSVRSMAETLFSGGSVNGDTAYIEAAESVHSFIHLVDIGVPFPKNEYGEYVGYKTDNDDKKRGTSAGPLTSKYMTEALEKKVIEYGIPIMDGLLAVKLAAESNTIRGLICLDRKGNIKAFTADNIIMATGGPAGVYSNVVYPESQTGMTGMALETGAKCVNMAEWQYGIASVKFRWNLSGSYQQVIPRYYSVGEDGKECEFLKRGFGSNAELFGNIFLKGYEWPFGSDRLEGSSKIDRLVYEEELKGRKVYIDYRNNPEGFDLKALSPAAYEYLTKSDAIEETPVMRLNKMNPKAIALYLSHNIDLYKEPLQISLCAQHCNGGIAVDKNWESSVKGLYAVGEAAGTFGITRPGGSALNSGQVGALRAAEHIAGKKKAESNDNNTLRGAAEETAGHIKKLLSNPVSDKTENRICMQKRMSEYAAAFRQKDNLPALYEEITCRIRKYFDEYGALSPADIPYILTTRDILITQAAMISSMIKLSETAGSRGGAVFIGEGIFAENVLYREYVLTVEYDGNNFMPLFEKRRPLPDTEQWFEKVWNKNNK